MFLPDPSPGAIREAVAAVPRQDGWGVMIFIAEEGRPDLAVLVEQLQSDGRPFCGAVFPAVLQGAELHTRGALVLPVPFSRAPLAVPVVDGKGQSEIWEELATDPLPDSAFVWLDGMAPGIDSFLDTLYNSLRTKNGYFGGGAGIRSREAVPCLFTQQGVVKEGAVVALTAWKLSFGMSHGWQSWQGPYFVTRSDGRNVRELNWRNAYEVYGEAIAEDVAQPLTRENFPVLSRAYPLGLVREGQDSLVRNPIGVSAEGCLRCVGEVPENAVLEILKGDKRSLVAAAAQAATDCGAGVTGQFAQGMIVDCVSRWLFLADEFAAETQCLDKTLRQKWTEVTSVPGVLTLGEIAARGGEALELRNKAVIVGAFYE